MKTEKPMDLTKLANRARSLTEHVNGARAALRDMQEERARRASSLAKYDDARAVLVEGLAKLDEAIGLLTASLGALDTGKPAVLPRRSIEPSPVRRLAAPQALGRGGKPRRTSPGGISPIRQSVLDAVGSEAIGTSEIRTRLGIAAKDGNSVRPAVLDLVRQGRLVRTGTVGKYLYALPAGASVASASPVTERGSVRAKRAVVTKSTKSGTVRSAVLDALASGPAGTSELRERMGLAPKAAGAMRSAVTALAEAGQIARTGARASYVYTLLSKGSSEPSGAATVKRLPARNVAARKVLDKALAAEAVKEGVSPAPFTVAKAGRGVQMNKVLSACRTPMAFGKIAEKLPEINRDVLYQTVYTLFVTGRLRRTGAKGQFVFQAAA